MKKEKLITALAAGIGAAALAYILLPGDDIPEGATAVNPFDKNRYLGKWYEIARLPSRIEKDIKYLTEDYTLDTDDDIKVVTRGYNTKKNKWIEATGKIKFAGSAFVGMLKVSYFGPFYAAYNVLDIDAGYRYALVSGSGLGYLWILSRETSIPDDIKRRFLNTAHNIGFAVDQLEWV